MRRHQEEISAPVPHTLFCEEASGGVVCFAAVIRVVTQLSSPLSGEGRCVMTLITAAKETSGGVANCRRLFSQAFPGTFSGPKENPVISFFIFCSTTPLLYHTDLRTEAHVPTPRYDQYLTVRAHNHITLVVVW